MFLFSFIVAPIVLGMLYGLMYKKMLDKSIELQEMTVYTAISETDQYKPIMDELLNNSSLSFIQVQQAKRSTLEETLKEDSSALGIYQERNQIIIMNNGKDSIEKNIVTGLVTDVLPMIASQSDFTEAEMKTFIDQYLTLSSKDYTQTQDVNLAKKLNSTELMLIGVFSAMSLFIAITFAGNFLRQRENALIERLVSINIRSKGIYIGSVVSTFVFSFITVLIYTVLAYGIILKMNILSINMLIACLLQAGFITAFYGLSIGLFRRETVYKNSIIPITMVIMVLGGSFFPAEMFIDYLWIMKLMPNYNILVIVKEILLGASLIDIAKPMLILTSEIILFVAIGAIRFQVRERGTKHA